MKSFFRSDGYAKPSLRKNGNIIEGHFLIYIHLILAQDSKLLKLPPKTGQ